MTGQLTISRPNFHQTQSGACHILPRVKALVKMVLTVVLKFYHVCCLCKYKEMCFKTVSLMKYENVILI